MRLDNNYRLKIVARIKYEDGTFSPVIDDIAQLTAKEKTGDIQIGYTIVGMFNRKTPALCNKWNDTAQDAIEDYRRHILQKPSEKQTDEKLFETKGQRKPTYLEEIKSFSSVQMAKFLTIIATGGNPKKTMAFAVDQAMNTPQTSLPEFAAIFKNAVEETDDSAQTCVPDLKPTFKSGNFIRILTPNGSISAEYLPDDEYPALSAIIHDAAGDEISSVILEYNAQNAGYILRVYEPDSISDDPSMVIPMSQLHPEKQYDWGDFKTITNMQDIMDLVKTYNNDGIKTEIHKIDHDALILHMTNEKNENHAIITVMWQNPKLRGGYPVNISTDIKINGKTADPVVMTEEPVMGPDPDWRSLLRNAIKMIETNIK